MPFSVGDGGGTLDEGVVVVVVVVVVDGACPPLLPHPAVNMPIAISAPPPMTAIKRRVDGFELIISELAMRVLFTSYVILFQRNSQRPLRILQANPAMVLIESAHGQQWNFDWSDALPADRKQNVRQRVSG